MEDSFFGFDASVPFDEDGGGGRIAEPSEEEYDALNDETFGSATNGDWEEVHENLVRLTDNVNGASGNYSTDFIDSDTKNNKYSSTFSKSKQRRRINQLSDSDLELNLSDMKLDDICIEDGENIGSTNNGGTHLDLSVWAANPSKSLNQSSAFFNSNNNLSQNSNTDKTENYLREHFHNLYPQGSLKEYNPEINANFGLNSFVQQLSVPKICTLEDIEKNILRQQAIKQDQINQHQQSNVQHFAQTPTPVHHQCMTQEHQNQQQVILQKQLSPHHQVPPGFAPNQTQIRASPNLSNSTSQHHVSNLIQQQHHHQHITPNRPPIGVQLFPPAVGQHMQQTVPPLIPPHPLLNQQGLSHNFAFSYTRPLHSPHLPVALNNFAMHPNFAAMRAAAAASGIHTAALMASHQQLNRLPSPPNPALLLNQQQSNSMFNVFNMRLVQEIQQNHPLLQSTVRQTQCQQYPTIMQPKCSTNSGILKIGHNRREGLSSNGNLPSDEFDEYANLMSTRDKHWLIGIQLSQLNTDTPYIDDYYYTVYRERKVVSSGKIRNSQAHKDNQLNHPLTQPKGHAQLILVQLGNKNGTPRNGQQRDRRSSESSNVLNNSKEDQKIPYVFTPMKFENSLGKLQYGSVTAPRKIIDAEIMSVEGHTENTAVQCKSMVESIPILPAGTINKVSTLGQRKTRDVLLHIESLFRVILKLEDLDNPTAIATIIMKKKKESERLAALEQIENANKNPEDDVDHLNGQTFNISSRNKFNYEIETKDALINKLVAALTHDKVMAMMNIRKGKVLLRRIMPYLTNEDMRWNIWIAIFCSLQNVIRKDRDDNEGVLYGLYPEFKNQIKYANFDTIIKIAVSISINDKKTNGIFCNKFGISALVCLILQAEKVYVANNDPTFDVLHKENWRQFLKQVATSLDQTIQSETISAAIESDSIQPMMNHFARFKNLKLDALLALIKEAKQQIN